MNTNNQVKVNAVPFGDGEFKLMVYDGGDTALSEYDYAQLPPDSKWFAYAYTSGSYEGYGYGLIAHDDGHYTLFDMGHCSCYGPMEQDFAKAQSLNQEELEARIDKDFNGKEIVKTDYFCNELFAMWEAAKLAIKNNAS